jgi:hypothetical protein
MPGPPACSAFSPKPRQSATGKRRFGQKLYGQSVLIAFSRDSKRLATITGLSFASGRMSSEVTLRDTTTGLELSTLRGPVAFPLQMEFTDTKLLLVSMDILLTQQTSLQVWDATPLPEKRP